METSKGLFDHDPGGESEGQSSSWIAPAFDGAKQILDGTSYSMLNSIGKSL